MCGKPTVFINIIEKTIDKVKMPRIYLVGCSHCKVGDTLPSHPTWTVTDLYNFAMDNWRNSEKVPEFKYNSLRKFEYTYFLKTITLGKITVRDIKEEGEFEEI